MICRLSEDEFKRVVKEEELREQEKVPEVETLSGVPLTELTPSTSMLHALDMSSRERER